MCVYWENVKSQRPRQLPGRRQRRLKRARGPWPPPLPPSLLPQEAARRRLLRAGGGSSALEGARGREVWGKPQRQLKGPGLGSRTAAAATRLQRRFTSRPPPSPYTPPPSLHRHHPPSPPAPFSLSRLEPRQKQREAAGRDAARGPRARPARPRGIPPPCGGPESAAPAARPTARLPKICQKLTAWIFLSRGSKMATYPPRRLLGARPLPSDPRRDPRRSDFPRGGGGRWQRRLPTGQSWGWVDRFPRVRDGLGKSASLPHLPPRGLHRVSHRLAGRFVASPQSLQRAGPLRPLRLPWGRAASQGPRALGPRRTAGSRGGEWWGGVGPPSLGTRNVFVFVFVSDTPPPSTSASSRPHLAPATWNWSEHYPLFFPQPPKPPVLIHALPGTGSTSPSPLEKWVPLSQKPLVFSTHPPSFFVVVF